MPVQRTAAAVDGHEPESVRAGESEVHRREKDSRQILYPQSPRNPLPDLRAVQIEHEQTDLVLLLQSGPVQQKMADVAVSVIQSGVVHPRADLGQTGNQTSFQSGIRRLNFPVPAEILERRHPFELGRDQERLPSGGVPSAFAERAHPHRVDSELLQMPDRAILVCRAENRTLELEKILENLLPSDASVQFDNPISAEIPEKKSSESSEDSAAAAAEDKSAPEMAEPPKWEALAGRTVQGVVMQLCPNPQYVIVLARLKIGSRMATYSGTCSIPHKYRPFFRQYGKILKVEFLPVKNKFAFVL